MNQIRLGLLCGAAALTFCLGFAGHAAAAPAPIQVVSRGPAIMPGAEQFVVHSARVGRDFLIVVTPPQTPVLPGQKLPAIYALDAGYGVAGQESHLVGGDGGMAPAFVVEIGYRLDQPNDRTTDLAFRPYQDDSVTYGGGGAAFEAFLLEELRPFIESRYPIDPNQAVLFGHSLAGLFAANVLADRPEAFRAYLIGSPSIWVDPDVLTRVAAAASRGQGRRVFIGVGGKEPVRMTNGAEQLAAVLSKPPSTFVVQEQVFEGEVHVSYYPQLVTAAFRYAEPAAALPVGAREIAIDPLLLGRYVGVYHLADGRTATVTARDGRLFGQLTGLPQVELFAKTPSAFFVKGFDAQMEFKGGDSGPARGVTLRLNGVEADATRAD